MDSRNQLISLIHKAYSDFASGMSKLNEVSDLLSKYSNNAIITPEPSQVSTPVSATPSKPVTQPSTPTVKKEAVKSQTSINNSSKKRSPTPEPEIIPTDAVSPKKGKPQKDPNAPKKPLSAFFIFCREKRDALRRDNPKINLKDLNREIGKMWEETDPPRRVKYQDEARKLYEEYLISKEKYRSSHSDNEVHIPIPTQPKEGSSKSKKKKSSSEPKTTD